MQWLIYCLGLVGILPLDRQFKQRKKIAVDGFMVVELSADERVQFTDLAGQILALENEEERARNFIAMRLQIIAAALRTTRGVYVYDRNNPQHLFRIAAMPVTQVDRLLAAACNLSAMQWMLPEGAPAEPENPSKASGPAAPHSA